MKESKIINCPNWEECTRRCMQFVCTLCEKQKDCPCSKIEPPEERDEQSKS